MRIASTGQLSSSVPRDYGVEENGIIDAPQMLSLENICLFFAPLLGALDILVVAHLSFRTTLTSFSF